MFAVRVPRILINVIILENYSVEFLIWLAIFGGLPNPNMADFAFTFYLKINMACRHEDGTLSIVFSAHDRLAIER